MPWKCWTAATWPIPGGNTTRPLHGEWLTELRQTSPESRLRIRGWPASLGEGLVPLSHRLILFGTVSISLLTFGAERLEQIRVVPRIEALIGSCEPGRAKGLQDSEGVVYTLQPARYR